MVTASRRRETAPGCRSLGVRTYIGLNSFGQGKRTRLGSDFLEKTLGLGIVWQASRAKGSAVWVPPDRSEAWEEHPWNQARIRALADDGERRYIVPA